MGEHLHSESSTAHEEDGAGCKVSFEIPLSFQLFAFVTNQQRSADQLHEVFESS